LLAPTVSVDPLPARIVVGLAVMLTVGAAGATGVTVTVELADVLPPAPVAVAV
jgi:hypothetical protein